MPTNYRCWLIRLGDRLHFAHKLTITRTSDVISHIFGSSNLQIFRIKSDKEAEIDESPKTSLFMNTEKACFGRIFRSYAVSGAGLARQLIAKWHYFHWRRRPALDSVSSFMRLTKISMTALPLFVNMIQISQSPAFLRNA